MKRCPHLTRLTFDNCCLDTRSRVFADALLGMSKLNVLSAVGTKLPHSILSQYVLSVNSTHPFKNLSTHQFATTSFGEYRRKR